jgi:hypothetical protein
MKQSTGNWYVLVYNLDIEESPCQLGQGVTIRHLDHPISVFDLAAAGASGFREWAMLEPFLTGCVCEIESAQDAAIKPGYDALNRAWLASALLKLKGYSAHLPLACNYYSWDVVAEHQERTKGIFEQELREKGVKEAVHSEKRALPQFNGQLLEYHTKLLVPPSAKTILSKRDADWIKENYEKFNGLAAKADSFRFALTAAVDWQYSSDPRIAIARLWSGIEALFGINSELVYRISLLIACLLESRGAARQARFAQARRLYGIRSKAVHGEEISEQKLTHAMLESSDILSRLLLVNLGKGHAFTTDDFDEAVFY